MRSVSTNNIYYLFEAFVHMCLVCVSSQFVWKLDVVLRFKVMEADLFSPGNLEFLDIIHFIEIWKRARQSSL